ncbi:MAG: DUF4416 family protein [Candidatus Omnitrophica bacterium]|nr:DUF4416 family protein [Candidatus Omnitrophota bacterium]
MGAITRPNKVLLIMGLLYTDEKIAQKTEEIVQKKFGPLLSTNLLYSFHHTDYYTDELGNDIKRKYCSFKKMIKPETLAAIKVITNAIEKKFSRKGKRRVNIDPGYVDLSKLVLASTKDFSHRIYLGKGIFAEITLLFKKGSYTLLPWTYPDYREEETIRYFNTVRNTYHTMIKKSRNKGKK